jgi:ATP-dependent RNA helicase SUPV3L1/SUV3
VKAILRLEMAAEVPTPADHLNERRALQLQLLTRKNQPGPSETWALDVTAVLSSSHDTQVARRLQNALKNLLRS